MIERLEGFPDNVVAGRCSGQISREDYVSVLVPAVEAAFSRHPKVSVYFETGPEFDGFDPGAMWEDLRLGMAHFTGWDRVAIVTDVAWLSHATNFIAFLNPARIRLFPTAEGGAAKSWVSVPAS